jgi:hypothetical protein
MMSDETLPKTTSVTEATTWEEMPMNSWRFEK